METLTINKMPYERQVQEWQYSGSAPNGLINNNHADSSHWMKVPFNTYGKSVTQNFLAPDGTNIAQEKKMEIVQARTASGSLQVVRAQTIQKSSSRTFGNQNSSHTNTNTITTPFSSSPINLKNLDNRIVVKMRNESSPSYVEDRETSPFNRAKSVSTDDLPSQVQKDKTNDESDDDIGIWNRVSRIRRSLQFPETRVNSIPKSSRPSDFPKQAVDVNRIRQELENISRRNSIVRSNSNESTEPAPEVVKDTKINRPTSDYSSSCDLTPSSASILKQVRSQLQHLEDTSPKKDVILRPKTTFSPLSDDSRLQGLLNRDSRSSSSDTSKELSSFLRRQSYGFEKLHDQDRKEQDFKMESSTDSGLSMSNDLTPSSWQLSPPPKPRVKLSPTRITLFNDSHVINLPNPVNGDDPKRHTTSLEGILDEANKKQKKVEFCKTEIHFAPDSGRVNIVETDEKPAPSNNFRRRRRSGGGSSNSSAQQSDDEITSPPVVTLPDDQPGCNDVKISVTTEVIPTDSTPITPIDPREQQDDILIRGILKNKPVKPKQYHLGENIKDIDSIWGVKLKPAGERLSPVQKMLNDIEESRPSSSLYSKYMNEDKPSYNIETSVRPSYGFSTKIDLTGPAPLSGSLNDHFVTKLEINDTKPPSNGVDWSTSTTSKTSATALVPSSDLNKETKNRLSITSSVHELKSISLVKNTIKNHHDHFNCNKMTAHVEQQQQQYHFNNPRNNQIAVAHKLTQNISAVNEARTVKFNKDLDEAFRDLMNVSASLKQMAERSPLGYNSFRRHSIDNVLDEKETKQPEVTRRQQLQQPKLETIENDKRNGSDNSMEKLQQKPVPAPRRKISATTSGESTKNVERKQGVETNGITVLQLDSYKANSPIHIQLYSPNNSLQRPSKQRHASKPTPLPRSTLSDSEGVVKTKTQKVIAPFVNYPLKSGTRQLRQHELRYFGVSGENNNNQQRSEPKPHSKPSVAAVRRFYEVRTQKTSNNEYDRSKYESSEDDIPLDSVVDEPDDYCRVHGTLNGSSLDVTEVKPERRHEMSPQRDRRQDEEILDELTWASEEMLNTVKCMEKEEKEKKRKSRHHQHYVVEVMETINEKPAVKRIVGSVPHHTRDRSVIRERKSSLSSASSSECLSPFSRAAKFLTSSSTKRRDSAGSITNGSKAKSSSHRECRRMQRTASRDLIAHERESSSDDLASTQAVEPPRRVRRVKTVSDDKKESCRGKSEKGGDCVVHSARPKQPSPGVSSNNSSKDRIYTHRLRKVDNIANVKPNKTGSSAIRRSSKTRTSSSSKQTKPSQ